MVCLTVTVVRESLKRLILKHGEADNADISKQNMLAKNVGLATVCQFFMVFSFCWRFQNIDLSRSYRSLKIFTFPGFSRFNFQYLE